MYIVVELQTDGLRQQEHESAEQKAIQHGNLQAALYQIPGPRMAACRGTTSQLGNQQLRQSK